MIQLVELPLPIACKGQGQQMINRCRESGSRVFQARLAADCFVRATMTPHLVFGLVVAIGVQPGPLTPPSETPADDGLVDAVLAALRARMPLPELHELDRRIVFPRGARAFIEAPTASPIFLKERNRHVH